MADRRITVEGVSGEYWISDWAFKELEEYAYVCSISFKDAIDEMIRASIAAGGTMIYEAAESWVEKQYGQTNTKEE